MLSNSPFGYPLLTKHFYAQDDTSAPGEESLPSPLSDKLSIGARAVEMIFPLLLLLPATRAFAQAVAVCFHVFILLQFPLGSVQEWNVYNLIAAVVLFDSHDLQAQQEQHTHGDLSGTAKAVGFFRRHYHHFADALRSVGVAMGAGSLNPYLLYAYVLVSCLVLPVIGNLRCDLFPSSSSFRGARLSYLVAMRQYSGNWPRAYWLLSKSADHKLDNLIWHQRGVQQDGRAGSSVDAQQVCWTEWIASFWFSNELAFTHRLSEVHLSADETYSMPYKALAFDAMQTLNGGALPALIRFAFAQQRIEGDSIGWWRGKQRELEGLGVDVTAAAPSGSMGAHITEELLAKDFDSHFCLPVSALADVVLGETMGETNVVTTAVLDEIQRRCHFEPGELQLVSVESFPLRGALEAAWAIEDVARQTQIRTGWVFVDESKYMMPTPTPEMLVEEKKSKRRRHARGAWEQGARWMCPSKGLYISTIASGWSPRCEDRRGYISMGHEDRRGFSPRTESGVPAWPMLLSLLHTGWGSTPDLNEA
jgi:hypothetical protein